TALEFFGPDIPTHYILLAVLTTIFNLDASGKLTAKQIFSINLNCFCPDQRFFRKAHAEKSGQRKTSGLGARAQEVEELATCVLTLNHITLKLEAGVFGRIIRL